MAMGSELGRQFGKEKIECQTPTTKGQKLKPEELSWKGISQIKPKEQTLGTGEPYPRVGGTQMSFERPGGGWKEGPLYCTA